MLFWTNHKEGPKAARSRTIDAARQGAPSCFAEQVVRVMIYDYIRGPSSV